MVSCLRLIMILHQNPKTRITIYSKSFLCFFLCFFVISKGAAQTEFQWNLLADMELSRAGAQSHFYYNEIDKDHRDLRVGLSQLNVIGKLMLNANWMINGRVLLERDKGIKTNRLVFPQLNVQWLSKERRFGITAGSFINPFGAFNEKQLSIDRDFIGLPLAYSYYVNISDQTGFTEGLGDIADIRVNNTRQWGSTIMYYGGYSTGALFSWNLIPGKVNWKTALVTGASNSQKSFTDPLHAGIISRLKVQATYFWEQGLSLSHGSFLRKSEVSTGLDQFRNFRQTLIGTDFRLGMGFLEVSGELIGVFYKTPVLKVDDDQFDPATWDTPVTLSGFSGYANVKYELPFLPGSYLAYRIDRLDFGEESYTNTSVNWDNDVLRHSLAAGYRISQNLLARVFVSTQSVDNKSWDKTQRTFRFVLTVHY